MKAVVICCDSCSHSWSLTLDDPVYLQLDLSSRPCPHCEACTLSCRSGHDSRAHHRPRLRRPAPPRHALAGPALG